MSSQLGTGQIELHRSVVPSHDRLPLLGGYICSSFDKELWVQEKVSLWTSVVIDLAFTVLSHPQTASTGLHKTLQHEWQFLQRFFDGIGDTSFTPIEEAISDLFLLAHFGGSLECDCHPKPAKLPLKSSTTN
jgi:hypothetical protein